MLPASAARGPDKDEESVPEKMQRIRRGWGPERSAALRELGSINKDQIREFKVVQFIVGIIRDENESPRLRRTAVEVVIAMASGVDTAIKQRILPHVVKVLDAGGETAVMIRSKIAQKIHKIVNKEGVGDDKRAISTLERIARGKEPPILKIRALYSLGLIGARGSNAVIRPLMNAKDEAIKEAARDAMNDWIDRSDEGIGDRPGSALGSIYAKVINNAKEPLKSRIAALKLVAKIQYKAAIPEIERLLKSQKVENKEDEELVVEAVKALSSYRAPKTIKTLIGVYRRFSAEDDAQIRSTVCSALGQFYQKLAAAKRGGIMPADQVTKLLVDATYEDKSSAVVRAATLALGDLDIGRKFKRKTAIEALIQALDDPDQKVRANCKDSLELLTYYIVPERPGEKAKDFQKRWMKWWKKHQSRFR